MPKSGEIAERIIADRQKQDVSQDPVGDGKRDQRDPHPRGKREDRIVSAQEPNEGEKIPSEQTDEQQEHERIIGKCRCEIKAEDRLDGTGSAAERTVEVQAIVEDTA